MGNNLDTTEELLRSHDFYISDLRKQISTRVLKQSFLREKPLDGVPSEQSSYISEIPIRKLGKDFGYPGRFYRFKGCTMVRFSQLIRTPEEQAVLVGICLFHSS